MVFIYHNRKYWREELHPEFTRFINEFHLGVALFFVLSGFLIAYTYADKPMRSGSAYTRYILQRMARILPLYWLILTLYYIDPAFGKGKATWLTYTLAHGFSDQYNLDGIAQAWSLTVEMTFYFLAPFLVLLQKRHWLYLVSALVLLFVVARGVGMVWYGWNGNPGRFFYPDTFLITSTFPGHATQFLAGMLLAQALHKNSTHVLSRFRYKTVVGFAGMVCTMYVIGLFQQNVFEHGNAHTGGLLLQILVLPVFAGLALAGLIQEQTVLQRFLGSRLLVLLGNASFAFYLIHISYVNQKIKSWFLLPDRNFIVLWLVAIILYLFFEKPVYDRCRKWLKPAVQDNA